MSGISLTASMRSNLLSLQNISEQVSSTQNKLSTGNKVNSAIDNPSSYYTALSLNNRADDLNALLDSMGQAVSTIKAATTALESATEFLEQAKAVANQALETAKVPDKAFFEEKVGENGAVVSTAQELRDAITAGKETICVYGAIDLGDISTTGGISLKENQKLVGIGYFGNYDTDTNKFSSISATANTAQNLINITKNNVLVSDLSLTYDNTLDAGQLNTIYISGTGNDRNEVNLGNLDIKMSGSDTNTQDRGTIRITTSANVSLTGNININGSGRAVRGLLALEGAYLYIKEGTQVNIQTTGQYAHGIFSYNTSRTIVEKGAQLDIKTSGYGSFGVYSYFKGEVYFREGSKTNIQTSGDMGYGLYVHNFGSIINIDSGAQLNIETSAADGYALCTALDASFNISGNVFINAQQSTGLYFDNVASICNINASAQLYFVANAKANLINYNNGGVLNIASGAKIAVEKDNNVSWGKTDNNINKNNPRISADNIKDELNLQSADAWSLPEKTDKKEENIFWDTGNNGSQYKEVLNQYDSLIKDAGYKGINLLQTDKLSVKFNEDNTAALEVQGRDMSSKALGFTIFEWQTQADISQAIEELSSAINSIRNYSSELGNNYNIITTRQDFTESLINVLTEGADKLTLADMNEESANMLALQTRQQLAINSLSLASQASQSILKLF